MQTLYYIYVYLDPRKRGEFNYEEYSFNNEPFYIGKGKDNRAFDHLKEVEKKHHRNAAKCNKIIAIYKENKIPIVLKIEENLTNDDANVLEKRLISLIGKINDKTGPLTNLTDGGDGGDTFTTNPNRELIRLKMSVRSSGERNPMYGQNHTDESRRKISDNRRGIRKGVHPWNYKKKLSDEHIANLRNSKIPINNCFAKKFIVIAPNGDKFEVNGNLKRFCGEHILAHSFMRYYINKGKIPPAQRRGSVERSNLQGWEIRDCGFINR